MLFQINICRNITRLHSLKLAPEIYCVFQNGLAYEYYPGVTLTVKSVTDIKIAALVAEQMAKMHKVELSTDVSFYYLFKKVSERCSIIEVLEFLEAFLYKKKIVFI